MKINELFEDGVITAYNTTVDVKPGETERQAAKLFPMNKGGKPKPLHSSAAKNSTPNKLFNLGLTENMSVTGTERRQLEKKKGIEVGTPEWFKHWFDLPYLREDITKQELLAKLKDQQRSRYIKAMLDAMHQLVQSKGARHSLGNYAYEIAKTFGYSPKELEKMYRDMYISEVNEAFDNPYPFKLTGPDESQSFVATAQTPNGPLRMDFETTDYDNFGIDFAVGKSMGKTEAGDEFRVFATVVAMMNKWINTVGIEHVESFDFGANKDEHASDGRAKLYTRFAKKLASQLGWKLEQSTTANRGTAFFKLTNPKPVPRDDEYWDALDEDVTQPQLNALEKAVDNVFGRIGIDVEFTRHFLDRANDERNGEPITIQELGKLFAKEYKRWGKPIAQMGPDTEAVMKDLESDINIPFALRWNGTELELIAKTVMRKKNFSTSNKQFPVENTQGSLAQKINWGGQNKPTAPKQQDMSWWQKLQNFADGKPKKKTNEGYKLQLERDTDMMVLNIVDTATGKRTEVRGKPGYETGGYDPKDSLHILLDKVGKSVDISQLMNGEPVGINPKHPKGASAKAATDKAYSENFADGKKKGKSRPGRVKKSGASCDGSVTSLRKKAKNSSGEKAKMYHWCANMKAGKKK